MSEFLVVVPPGWTQLDWAWISSNVPDMSYNIVIDKINNGGLGDIDAALKDAGVITQTIVEAKLIDDTYFLVKLG